MKRYELLWLIFIIGCLWFLIEEQGLRQHENVHKEIFEYHGCENVLIEYKLFSGKTICEHNMTRASIDAMMPLHMQNEIEYYNNRAIVLSVFALMLVVVLTLFSLSTSKRR